MNTATELEKQGYKGIKVTSMMNALLSKEIYGHLRLSQQDSLQYINNRFKKNKQVTKDQFTFMWNLYWNFVLNDFRFNDKNKTVTTVTKMKKIESKHPGMKLFLELSKA